MTTMTFVAKVNTPDELRLAIKAEVERRISLTQAQTVHARTVRESSRHAGAITALEGIQSLLDGLVIEGVSA